jgi:outer membrane receptor protein involved in Fe transport
VNPTIFYNDWTNIQVQSAVPEPAGLVFLLQNAGTAHTYGFELETAAKVTDSLLTDRSERAMPAQAYKYRLLCSLPR